MKNSTIKHLIFLCGWFLFLSSCSPLLGLYGVHRPKKLKEAQILRTAQHHQLPTTQLFQLDSSYFSILEHLKPAITDSSEKAMESRAFIKNHHQPLQALYFDSTMRLQSFQINCYAGGFPNLEWNRNGIMETFPPQIQAPIDSIFSFNELKHYFVPFSTTSIPKTNGTEYTVVVFWSKFMGRQNKRFLRIISNNLSLTDSSKVTTIFVNMDNAVVFKKLW